MLWGLNRTSKIQELLDCFCSVAATVIIKRTALVISSDPKYFPVYQRGSTVSPADNCWIPSNLSSPFIRGPVSPHKAGLWAENGRATSEISPARFLTCWKRRDAAFQEETQDHLRCERGQRTNPEARQVIPSAAIFNVRNIQTMPYLGNLRLTRH